jgi:DNA-binding transcriptional ArsR family regulator
MKQVMVMQHTVAAPGASMLLPPLNHGRGARGKLRSVPGRHAIADVASLIGEPTRAAILLALLGGSERPASELARVANLSAPATSLHLAKLVAAGLLAVRAQGRFRFYKLASAEVAHALEALGTIATTAPPARSLSPARAALRGARRCYDHLAGRLSIAVVDLFERGELLVVRDRDGWDVTARGVTWFAATLSIDVNALAGQRRPLARGCLDWSERKPHLAGGLGAALLDRLVEQRWVVAVRDSRALRMTPRGETGLRAWGLRM